MADVMPPQQPAQQPQAQQQQMPPNQEQLQQQEQDMSPFHDSPSMMDSDSGGMMLPPQTPNGRIDMSHNSMGSANSRRPPRKSTLTQQQKNQKRQRATQDQLMTLEIEFNKNPTPTALVRERIANDINMTERSVQIWFQNRRAKIKNIAKRSIESGEDCDSIPESMRQYLAMQQYGPGGKGHVTGMFGRVGPGFGQYGTPYSMDPDASSGKVVIQHFHCRSLSIGTWRRVGQSTMDLVIFYSPDKACVTYYINSGQSGYKIEYPFAWIKNITLEQGDVQSAAEGASQRSGGLLIELTRPPKFYMDSSGQGGFYECGDFTEDQQASQMMVHHLGGPSKVLSGQLAKLISLDAYQNRHNMFDPNVNIFAISAPVSPMRPASQPNHMMHPHQAMHLFQPDNGMGLMGPPAPRGHKRQRSRSVPAALDFSQFRNHPMPSFLIQHDGQPAPTIMQDPDIFAPIPQHQHAAGFAPYGAPQSGGPNLSIDTTAAYGQPMAFNPPMSATSANSPSEYGHPGFFGPGQQGDMGNPQFSTPFNNGFLAVDPGAMIGTSHTPLSMTSHGDPVIADHSPPLSSVGRSQSAADIFGTHGDQFGDDGLFLSESFNKQMALPFRSPMTESSFQSPLPNGDFNESQMVNFDCAPGQSQDGSMTFHSPGHHQDSAVAFSTPSHVPADQVGLFHSPNDNGIYSDSKVYSSPSQLHQVSEDAKNNSYTHSPMDQEVSAEELMHTIYGTVNPNNLGQHHS